jgi:hypothetical protein
VQIIRHHNEGWDSARYRQIGDEQGARCCRGSHHKTTELRPVGWVPCAGMTAVGGMDCDH